MLIAFKRLNMTTSFTAKYESYTRGPRCAGSAAGTLLNLVDLLCYNRFTNGLLKDLRVVGLVIILTPMGLRVAVCSAMNLSTAAGEVEEPELLATSIGAAALGGRGGTRSLC